MWKIIKPVLITLAVIAALAFFLFRDRIEFGTLFAGLATFFAAVKSKIFGETEVQKMIEEVEASHALKRDEWETAKQKYDAEIDFIKAKMAYHDYRSALVSSRIIEIDDVEKCALDSMKDLTDEEVRERLRGLEGGRAVRGEW